MRRSQVRYLSIVFFKQKTAYEMRISDWRSDVCSSDLIPLLKSETAIIDRPCLLLANEFGLVKRGKTIYAASLISDEPFFCIAAVWRPAHRLWPECFAALTVRS